MNLDSWLRYYSVNARKNVTSIAVADSPEKEINSDDNEKTRIWLLQIDEPIEDHCLVLNKCNCDHEAFIYFLKWAGKDEE